MHHETQIRVRYQETDAQGRVHHANFVTWFEIGRVEFLRSLGYSYRDLEESGTLLVVAEASCRYFLPAMYDDVLTIRTTIVSAKGARIQHAYDVFRGEELLAKGSTVIACVDREGKIKRLPAFLLVS